CIPVATSLSGKGAIREDHELSLGVMGRYSRPGVNEIVRDADTVLVVGCRLGGFATDTYSSPSADATLIQIDIDESVFNKTYRPTVVVHADAKHALRSLVQYAPARLGQDHAPWVRDASE